MARTEIDIATKKSMKEIEQIVTGFMEAEGFKKVVFHGEEAWKKGMGILTGPQFLKTVAKPGSLHLEAWIKYAIMPGWYVGEMGTTGFSSFAVKAALRGRVEKLQKLIAG